MPTKKKVAKRSTTVKKSGKAGSGSVRKTAKKPQPKAGAARQKKKVVKKAAPKRSGRAGSGSAGKVAKKKVVAKPGKARSGSAGKAAPKRKPARKPSKARSGSARKSMATAASAAPVTLIALDDVEDESLPPAGGGIEGGGSPEPEAPSVPPMEPMPQDDPKENTYLQSETCTSCRHIPVGVNAVVGMLSIMALALSIAVITSLITIESQDYQIRAFNAGGAYLEEVARL